MPIYFYESKIGKLGVEEQDNYITNIYFANGLPSSPTDIRETHLIKETISELNAYFEGKLKKFSIPYEPKSGTAFMRRIWTLLGTIPYGETATYGEIAALYGNKSAARAVGLANNKNPLPILVPCHRVVGANGKLVGFAGGLDIKEILLKIEKESKNNENK